MRALPLTIAAVAALAGLTGCFGDADLSTQDEGSYVLLGVLAENATEQERELLFSIVHSFDGEIQFSDSGPSFTAYGMSEPECDQLIEKLQEAPYVVELSECVFAEDLPNSDVPPAELARVVKELGLRQTLTPTAAAA